MKNHMTKSDKEQLHPASITHTRYEKIYLYHMCYQTNFIILLYTYSAFIAKQRLFYNILNTTLHHK